MMKIVYFLFLFVALLFIPVKGWTQLLIDEPFNYTPDASNDLAVQSGAVWSTVGSGNAALVKAGNLSYAGLPASSGNKISFDGEGMGYYRTFTGQSSGTVYASCIINVTALPTGTTGDYFIYLGNATAIASPVYLRAGSTAGKFNIGLAKRNNLAVTWLPDDLDLNTSHYIVFAITYVDGTANDVVKLWLDPLSTETTPGISISTGADLNVFANLNRVIINHGGTGNAGLNIEMDEMRISTAWINLTPSPVPAPPGALMAVTGSSTSISLNWTDNSNNETGFEIERSADGSSFILLTSVAVNITSYTDNGLSAGTQYYYRIRATGTEGNSGYSNIAGATTAVAPPATPATIAAEALSSSSISLIWTDNSDNETGFEIERSLNGTSFDLLATVGANTANYTDNGVAAATTYYYRVRATGTGGNSGYSNISEVTTPAAIPVAPTNLTAIAASSESVNLGWTDNSDNETGFEIERSSDGVFFTRLIVTEPNLSSYTDNGLTASTTYYYRIRAVGTAGSSAYTNIANATTSITIPAAPGTLTVTTVSSSSISLNWIDNSDNETGFEIERSSDGTSFTLLLSVTANNVAYTDNGLSPLTRYYYRVRAVGIAGSSAYSNIADAITDPPVPAAPASLTAVAGSASSIDLSWVDNSDNETGFEIERSRDGISFALLTAVAANTTSYTDNGLASSTRYYYRVRATGTGSNSAYSNSADATTNAVLPAAPGSLAAAAASSASINLTWLDNSDNETGFEIERSPNGTSFTLLTTVAANVASYTDNSLTANTRYYYRVRATGAAGRSAYSNIADATTNDVVPAAPGALSAIAGSSASVDLSWHDNSGNETGFMIERSADGTSFSLLTTVTANTVNYTDNGLSASTRYYYRVRATGTAGNSAYSNIADVITQPSVPAAPGELTVTAGSSASISLKWTDNSTNETWFEVERSTDGGIFTFLTTVAANSTTYTDEGLAASSRYYYRVRATGVAGNSAYSNIADAITAVGNGNKIEASNFLSPDGDGKNDKWIVKNIEKYPGNEVKVFDRAGRIIYSKKNYNNDWTGTINGSVLSEDTYYYIVDPDPGLDKYRGFITILRNK